MKRIALYSLACLFAVGAFFTSCESVKNTNNTQKGAGIGAVAGAVIGGVLGNNLGKGGNTALGAVLGGVVGGTVGGVIGNKWTSRQEKLIMLCQVLK